MILNLHAHTEWTGSAEAIYDSAALR